MPGGKGNIGPNDGVKFKKGQSGNPKGRPVKVFSAIRKEFEARGIERASADAVRDAYEYMLALPIMDIIEISGSPSDEKNKYPALYRIVAKYMTSKQGLEMLKDMLDRAHGKPTSKEDGNKQITVTFTDDAKHGFDTPGEPETE